MKIVQRYILPLLFLLFMITNCIAQNKFQTISDKYLEELKTRPTNKLSKTSKRIHEKAVALLENPQNEQFRLNYLNAFPANFKEFRSAFDPPDFDQLYDGYVYIELFKLVILSHPEVSGPHLLKLAKGACYGPDGPGYLRNAIEMFKEKFPSIYKKEFDNLKGEEQWHIWFYFNADLQTGSMNNEGLCKP